MYAQIGQLPQSFDRIAYKYIAKSSIFLLQFFKSYFELIPLQNLFRKLCVLMQIQENVSCSAVDDLDANPVAQSKEILGSEDTSEKTHVDSQTIDPSTKPKQGE